VTLPHAWQLAANLITYLTAHLYQCPAFKGLAFSKASWTECSHCSRSKDTLLVSILDYFPLVSVWFIYLLYFMCLWTDILTCKFIFVVLKGLFISEFFLLYALHFFSVIATVYVRLSHLRKVTFLLTYDTYFWYTEVFLYKKKTSIQHSINMHKESRYNKQN